MVAISKSRVKQRHAYSRKEKFQEKILLSILGVLVGIYGLLKIMSYQTAEVSSRLQAAIDDHRPHLKLQSKNSPLLSESLNAIAADIMATLKCEELLNKTLSNGFMNGEEGPMDDIMPANINNAGEKGTAKINRRLQAAPTDDGDDTLREEGNHNEMNDINNNEGKPNNPGFDDGVPGGMYDDVTGWDGYFAMTGKELFCLAAATATIAPEKIKNYKERIQCDATGTKQVMLLELWNTARGKITNEALLIKTLGLAVESTRTLGPHTVHLWAPRNDDGMNYVLTQINNEEESARVNGNNFYGLSHNLGPDHLYVDVGSCLGITSLAVILQYPKTKVLSIEPASPNWLMQEINMKCNLDEDQQPLVLLTGVGPHTRESMAAKLLWRPSAVTSTRAWTPSEEKIATEDEDLFVELRPWKSILGEAGVYSSHHIDVLHLDCEGCEYNLIPALTDSEFESIDTVMGEMHWGYIPQHKLPSSKRGQLTHDRLCQHENFARTAKECCGNLQLPVKSAFPGEVLIQDGKDITHSATVADVINEGLCDDFSAWKETHQLYHIDNDYGWFEMTSTAT